MKKGFFQKIKINKIVQTLTYSDVMFFSSWGLVNPILSIYFAEEIRGGNAAVAGLAIGIFLITKSMLQLPIARYVESNKGEWDDFWIMMAGSLIVSASAFLLVFCSLPWHIYSVQAFQGAGSAMMATTWSAIFTKHLDKSNETLEWGFHHSSIDFGSGVTAVLGGFIASSFGYENLFKIIGWASLIGSMFLASVADYFKRK